MNPIDPRFVNKILHADCVEGMKRLPDCCIPLTVTSPPYDKLRRYGGHDFKFEPVAEELWRITMDGGIVVWVVGEEIKNGSETGTAAEQKLFFKKLGFRCSTMVMVTTRVRYPQRVRYVSAFDYAYVFTKGRPRYVNVIRDKRNKWAGTRHKPHVRGRDGVLRKKPLDKPVFVHEFGDRSNVWHYDVGGCKTTKDKDAYAHPALMCEKMAADHVVSWSRPGDLVLDCMCGAATTCKMALLNHRRYLGMEIHEEYVRIAENRLERARQENKRRLDALIFGDEIENRLGGNANGKEFDETAADAVPHRECPCCRRRIPI